MPEFFPGLEFMENVKKYKIINWDSPAAWILLLSLIVSISALVIYLKETDYSDETLFLLLTVLRYSSFLVCICSFYKILVNIYRIFRRQKASIFKVFIYLIFLIYGLCIIFLETVIVVISGGI